jgi:membrane protein DedA with SNARE-associated domain
MKCRQNRYAFLLTHFQLLIGLILYFISPKVIFAAESMKEPLLRFFLVEHIALMLVAVVLITVGFIKFQKAEEQKKRHKITVIYYGIALLLMLVSIPWPFRNLGGGWY